MSADDTICGCNGVTKGSIVHAILEQELTTFEEVKVRKPQVLVVNVVHWNKFYLIHLEMLLMPQRNLPVCVDVHLYPVMKS